MYYIAARIPRLFPRSIQPSGVWEPRVPERVCNPRGNPPLRARLGHFRVGPGVMVTAGGGGYSLESVGGARVLG
jgi:hypothetical protein